MRWKLAAFKNGLLDAMAYRWEFLLNIFASAAGPLITQLVIWGALFKQSGGNFGGVTHHEMIMYAVASVLFSQVRGGDLDFELAELIRSGQLSNYMLRPVGVIEFIFIRGSSPRFFIAFLCFLLGLIFVSVTGQNPARLCGAIGLALMGNLIHFQIGATLATTSFLWEESYSVLMVKNMIVSLLSGELFPLFLFPEKWSWIYKITPFYLYVYGPAQYTIGKWSHEQFVHGLGMALLWLMASALAMQGAWKLGYRRYLSIGG
jgi:ABC-2 type transport system permease protein